MKPKSFLRAGLAVLLVMLLLQGCGFRGRVRLDRESQEFYETARLIMTGEEKDIFRLLPDKASREEFIEDFWAKRDPDPDTEVNEFREEFFRRIEYANKHFLEGIPGWKTDRGRIYIYLGPPDKIERRPYINDPNVKGLIWWGYYRYRLGLEFIDRTGDGRYTLNRQAGAPGGLLEVIEQAKFGQVFQDQGDFGAMFKKFRAGYDARTRELFVSIPVEALSFSTGGGKLRVEFRFAFFIYQKKGSWRDRFQRDRVFEASEEEILGLERIVLSFPYELERGEYFVDVVVTVKPKVGKFRKIFRVKV